MMTATWRTAQLRLGRGLSSQAILSPMTNLAALKSTPPMRVVRGSGSKVYDDQGKEYYEGMAGLWCTSLGWGNEELVEAAASQMRTLSYYHGFTGRRVPIVEELAEKLIAGAPINSGLRDGGRVFFGMSGSDANDTQIRLIWHYNHARGRPEKRKFLARNRGYHGVSVASGSLTGLPYVHNQMGLPLDFVARHVTCPSYYREGLAGESTDAFVARLAAELDDAIVSEGGGDAVAAFIAEPLHGAGGVVVPPAGYNEAISRVCKKHDVLIIGDEVITGFGRTGAFWGSDALGLHPDLISCAKQLTSAYLPLSAVLLPREMYETMEEWTARSGSVFGHGYTYSAHPTACAVALKTIEIMERERIVEAVHDTLGPLFQARLRKLGEHALVGEARGIGLIGAVELVADKTTRAQHTPGLAPRVAQSALENGLIVRPLANDVVALCPPLVISPYEIDDVFDRLEAALDEIAATL